MYMTNAGSKSHLSTWIVVSANWSWLRNIQILRQYSCLPTVSMQQHLNNMETEQNILGTSISKLDELDFIITKITCLDNLLNSWWDDLCRTLVVADLVDNWPMTSEYHVGVANMCRTCSHGHTDTDAYSTGFLTDAACPMAGFSSRGKLGLLATVYHPVWCSSVFQCCGKDHNESSLFLNNGQQS